MVAHRNGDALVAQIEDGLRNPVSFRTEDETAVTGEVRFEECHVGAMRMGSDALYSLGAELLQGLSKVCRLQAWQLENGSHRTADGATEVGAAAGVAGDESVSTEGCG